MKFFSVDGGLYKFMTSLFTLFKVNMLWLLCSLPIITMGAATIAAYDITLKMVDETEGYIAKRFFRVFKANLKRGIPMGLLNLFCMYVVWLDFSLFHQLEDNPIIFLIVGILAVAVFVLAFIYAYPLQALYENTVFKTLENSFHISIRHIGRTLFLVAVLAVEFVIIFWNLTTVFVGLLIGPACVMFTISGTARYIFRQLEKEPGAVSNPEQL